MSIREGQVIDSHLPNMPLIIQNPFLPERNVSQNVGKIQMKKFIKLCASSAKVLQDSNKDDDGDWGWLRVAKKPLAQ